MNFGIKIAMLFALIGVGIIPAGPALAADDILLKSQSNGLCLDGYKRGQDIRAARCRTPFKAQRWSINPESGELTAPASSSGPAIMRPTNAGRSIVMAISKVP